MRSPFALLLLLSIAGSARATDEVRVPAATLIAAGQAAMQAKADDARISVRLTPVGRLGDVVLPAGSVSSVEAGMLADPWLRPRIGVPVRVMVAGEKRATATVWFSVVAIAVAPVYSAAYPRGASADSLVIRSGEVDLARTHGRPPVDAAATAGHRLTHAVDAGQAALAADFEAIPVVAAQQVIRIESMQGVVHLSIVGRALADGDTGQIISVLPSGASQPVRARVISPQVVAVEN